VKYQSVHYCGANCCEVMYRNMPHSDNNSDVNGVHVGTYASNGSVYHNRCANLWY
jgi:hypothetical protein